MPRFNFSLVTNNQIHQAISKLWPYKAPRLDRIPNVILMQCAGLLMPHLGPIDHSTFKLGIFPNWWKDSVTIMLRNPAP